MEMPKQVGWKRNPLGRGPLISPVYEGDSGWEEVAAETAKAEAELQERLPRRREECGEGG